MIIDSRLEFCDAAALDTSGTDTDLIGDVVDLGTARDVGHGEPVYLVITVDTAVTSGGAATVQFHLASDSQAAIATDGSATYHWSSGVVSKDTLTAGYVVAVVPLPAQGAAYERFLGILTTVGGAVVTAGRINAFITADPHGWTAQPDAL